MEIKSSNLFPFGAPRDDDPDGRGPSGIYVLLCLSGAALALVGGYFLVMKLIEMSRLEDCLLMGRHNCMVIELPRNQ